MQKIALLMIPFVVSCTGLSYRAAQGTERCRDLESRYQIWGAASIAASTLAGSSAITSTAFDNEKTRLGIGLGSAATIAFAAAALFVRDDILSLYNDECGIETSTISRRSISDPVHAEKVFGSIALPASSFMTRQSAPLSIDSINQTTSPISWMPFDMPDRTPFIEAK